MFHPKRCSSIWRHTRITLSTRKVEHRSLAKPDSSISLGPLIVFYISQTVGAVRTTRAQRIFFVEFSLRHFYSVPGWLWFNPEVNYQNDRKFTVATYFLCELTVSRTGVCVLLKGKILLVGGCIVFGRVVNEWNGWWLSFIIHRWLDKASGSALLLATVAK